MNWNNKQFTFSIRKLKVAVASTVVGITTAGLAGPVATPDTQPMPLGPSPLTVQADSHDQQVSITYHYVNYADLSADQQARLIDGKNFSKEIAQGQTSYVLVYQAKKGLVQLPATGESASHLMGLLTGLGIAAIGLVLAKRDKQLVAKVLIVTGLGGAVLTTANSRALEAGLQSFLTETHLVSLGQHLPQPSNQHGDLVFSYYFPETTATQSQPTTPEQTTKPEDKVTSTTDQAPVQATDQPAVPVTPTGTEQPTDPTTPTATEQPTDPTTPTATEQPTDPTIPTATEQPTDPTTPTVTEQPTDPTTPTGTEQPTDPTTPTGTEQPTDPTTPTATEQPTDPTTPTATEQPNDPTTPTATEQPADPTTPTGTEQPTDPTTPTATEQPTDPTTPTATEQPNDPTTPTGTEQPTDPTTPTGTEQPTDPTTPTATEQPTDPTTPTGTEQPTDPTTPTGTEQPTDPTTPTGTEQPTDPTTPTGTEQPTDPTTPTGTEQPTDPTTPTGAEQPTDPTTPTGTEQPTDPTTPTGTEQPTAPLVDKTRLNTALTTANSKVEADYTSDSWANLATAKAAAQSVFDAADSTQASVDRATDNLNQALSQLTLKPVIKQKPSLTLTTVNPNELDRTASLSYSLIDPDQTFTGASISIYKGTEKLQDIAVTKDDLSNTTIQIPDYDTTYTIKTQLSYALENQPQTEQVDSRDLSLTLKKLEIKDADAVTLHSYRDGQFFTVPYLGNRIPSDLSQYMIRVRSSRFKDMLLPVKSIEEASYQGQPAYKVTTNIDQLVEGSSTDGYREQFSFYVGKMAELSSPITHRTDYTKLDKATSDRTLAYANVEKLLPFYNKETIVSYANKLGLEDKLNTKKLLSVTPMVDNQLIADVSRVRTELNRLMLHYEDESIDYLPLTYAGNFANPAISEYTIAGTNLIYTPEQFLSNYDAIVNAVLPTLEAVTYKSPSMLSALNIDLRGDSLSDAMDKLYLEDSFNAIKADLPNQLRNLLATEAAINTTGGAVDNHLIDRIIANKERILLGLAYLNRWYNINLTKESQARTINLKDLVTFHRDFDGKAVGSLEALINLTDGKEGYTYLQPSQNVRVFAEKISPDTKQKNLLDYLSNQRQRFTDFTDDNSWFKATAKAYVVEQGSRELPEQDVRVYSKLRASEEQNGILPLLTAQEGLFLISTMGSITYGMYDRYYNSGQLNGLSKAEQIAKIKERIHLTAERQATHFDAWYRLAPTDSRDSIIKPMPVWDGYFVNNNQTWLPLFGSGANQAIKDFFGPVGNRAEFAKGENQGAFADGRRIAFVYDRVLDDYGHSVFTHEAVHNNDGTAYLGNHDRRLGMGAENYALGLLQSTSYEHEQANFLTLNLIFDLAKHQESDRRYINVSPDRFKTQQDLQDYTKGIFDVLYTLDYAEAQAILTKPTELKRDWFGVIENYYENDKKGQNVYAGNTIRALTNQEAESLTRWEDLVDKNIVSGRGYDKIKYGRNGYYKSFLFSPNYAALSNDRGIPGDVMFRRIAYELLAEKGYEGGFIPYASSQLADMALAENSLTSFYMTNNGPLITDQHVLKAVFQDKYPDWASFKKDMFQKRIDKVTQLKPITINYLNQTHHITSFDDIKRLMDEAVAYDAQHGNYNYGERSEKAGQSHVNRLKALIYNAYLRDTDDFRWSIYKPAQPAEQDLTPAESLNLISNSSLETNDYTSNKPNRILRKSTNPADYTRTIDGNKVNKSKDNSANDFIFYEVNTVPGRTYTVTADIRIDVTNGHQADGAFFAVKVVEPNGNQQNVAGKGVNQMADSLGKWAQQTLTFTANSTKTHIGLVKWHNDPRHANTINTSILMDKLKVSENATYNEIWKDTFSAGKLDDQTWSYELGNVRGNEQQHYSSSKENVTIENGVLKITATDRPVADQYRNTARNRDSARLVNYNSGSVQTIGRQEFLYGRIEARMKLPKGKGVFPAFWTLGADFNIANRISYGQGYGWPATGEIDIMELVGVTNGIGNQRVYGTPHFYYPASNDDGNIGSDYHGTLTLNEDFADDYHVFGINWSEDRIEWYVDDIVYNTLIYDDSDRSRALKAGFNRPQYIQFNLAMGGNWPGDAGNDLAGQALEVDWVRWLQSDKQKADMERYYADKPKLSGVEHVTIVKGEVPNLLEAVSIDRDDYRLEVSVDDEFMFVNTGAPDGRNEPRNVVADASKISNIANLEAGVYNIFYTTIPKASDFNPRSIPVYKMTRGWSHLIILPNYYGAKAGDRLASLTLPEGWRWVDPSQKITADGHYELTITNTKDPINPEHRREYTVKVSGQALMKVAGH